MSGVRQLPQMFSFPRRFPEKSQLARLLPRCGQKAPGHGHYVSRQLNCRNEMKHQHHFDPMTPRLRQMATILGMIDDLNGFAGHLDCDIAAQEHAQEIASPLLVSLTSRRDRLRETLALLETRLADIRGFQG
jgi:hypothetical protein